MGLPGILLGCDGEQPPWDLGQVTLALKSLENSITVFFHGQTCCQALVVQQFPPHLAQEAKISINSQWQRLGDYGLAPNSTSSEDTGS